jgi:hypothetical protein
MHSGAGLAAAARLASLPAWRAARLVKANPDAPQLPVRARALTDRPQGIRREHLDAARIAAIPALATRAPRRPYN